MFIEKCCNIVRGPGPIGSRKYNLSNSQLLNISQTRNILKDSIKPVVARLERWLINFYFSVANVSLVSAASVSQIL